MRPISSYFCFLEKGQFIDNKMVKKITLDNGDIVSTRKDILNHGSNFYARLFCNRDNELLLNLVTDSNVYKQYLYLKKFHFVLSLHTRISDFAVVTFCYLFMI